jgi:hypothetical protein
MTNRPSTLINRTNKNMTTSVSRRLNILFTMFKIISLAIRTLLSRLVHSSHVESTSNTRITSLRRYILAHKTSLNPPLFITIPVLDQVSVRSCLCELAYTCRFYLILRFWYLILELLWQCGIFVFYSYESIFVYVDYSVSLHEERNVYLIYTNFNTPQSNVSLDAIGYLVRPFNTPQSNVSLDAIGYLV